MNNKFKVARKLLNPLWMKSRLRCSLAWGPKKQDNPYSGVNLVMAVDKELVVVSEGLIMSEFRETSNTNLGRRVEKILAGTGLHLIKANSRQAKTLKMVALEALLISDRFWHCPICKQGEAIESEGQTALERAYKRHEEISPDCETANIKLYQWVDGNLVELQDLSLITSAKRP